MANPYVLTVAQDSNVELTLNNGGAVPADPVPLSSLSGLPPGEYQWQPLAWNAGTEAWEPAPEIVTPSVSFQDSELQISGTLGVNIQSGTTGIAQLSANGASVVLNSGEGGGNELLGNYIWLRVPGGDTPAYFDTTQALLAPAAGIMPTTGAIWAQRGGGGQPMAGFFDTPPIVKPEVTGVVDGNTALASLLTALADLGLITNSTT